MFIAIFNCFVFLLLRPLAMYRIYPGAIALIMAGPIQEAQMHEAALVERGGEKVFLTTKDHRQIESTFFQFENSVYHSPKTPAKTSRPVVLICMGNNQFYQLCWSHIDFYLSRGFHVMAFNYGGYCNSQGVPTAQHTFHDVQAAYLYLKKRTKAPDKSIIAHGQSLGGGPATYLASQYPIHLVLDRTYATLGRVSSSRILQFLADYFYPYDNVGRIAQVKGHIHLIEASQDKKIIHKHTEELFLEIIRNRHPDANSDEILALKERYITTVEGPHGACLLENDPCFEPAQKHFVSTFLQAHFPHSFNPIANGTDEKKEMSNSSNVPKIHETSSSLSSQKIHEVSGLSRI